MPRWWLWLFLASIAFALAYLLFTRDSAPSPDFALDRGVAIPGRGGGRRTRLHAAFRSSQRQEPGRLGADPMAMATARNLFALNCSTCHGSDARGAIGFPNLTDNDWLHGRQRTGRLSKHRLRPRRADAGVGSGARPERRRRGDGLRPDVERPCGAVPDASRAGKIRFGTMCAACHGPDGKGNQVIGAPNLTDNIWL